MIKRRLLLTLALPCLLGLSAQPARAQDPLQISIAGLRLPPGSPLTAPVRKVLPGSVNADGTVIAYERIADASSDVWVLDLRPSDDRKARRRVSLEANGRSPGLDAAGDAVAYAVPVEEPGGAAFRILRQDLGSDSPPVSLACYAAGEIEDVRNLHLSPDGSRAVYEAVTLGRSVIHRTEGVGADCDLSPPPPPTVIPFPCCVGAGGQMRLASAGQVWTQDGSTFVFSVPSGLPAKPIEKIFSHDGTTLRALSCPSPFAGESDSSATIDAGSPEQVHFLRTRARSTSLMSISLTTGCPSTTSSLGPLTGTSMSDPAVSLDGATVVFASDHDPGGGFDLWELDLASGLATNRTRSALPVAPTAAHVVGQGSICYYGQTEPNDLRAVNLSRGAPWATTSQDVTLRPADPFFFTAAPLSCTAEIVTGGPALPSTRVLCKAQLGNSSLRERTLLAYHDLSFNLGLRRFGGPVLTQLAESQDMAYQVTQVTTCEPVQGYAGTVSFVQPDLVGEDVVASQVFGITIDGSAWCLD
ncbi:MAG: hypothetical protein AAF533_11830 [Acidobacteriota bacterium]